MNEKNICVIAAPNHDYPSFAARLEDLARWVDYAAALAPDLIVLPEALNLYCGDGVGNPNILTFQQAALDDWWRETAVLREAALRCSSAIAIPVVVRESGDLRNSFFLLSREGSLLGRYDKMFPTPAELEEGVVPGNAPPILWEGLRVGGAICFDTWFEETFSRQAAQGVQLYLVPSLWPGGDQLNHYARHCMAPIAVAYPAWSRIISIDGRELAAGGFRHETLRFGFGAPVYAARVNFESASIPGAQAQHRMVDLQKFYGPRVRMSFDQNNCLFHLESRDPALSIREVMETFELRTTQQYLAPLREAVAAHANPANK